MSLTTTCRDTAELNKLVRYLYNKAIKDIKAEGVTPLLVETYRSQERQNYLYCQGRTVSQCTAKGISSSFAKKYCRSGSKVTWTLNSKHKSRKAVDLIPQKKVNGKWTAIWSTSDAHFKKIISIMKSYGFEAGAEWSTPDGAHFQIDWSGTTEFKKGSTTKNVTKLIQRQLNKALKGTSGFSTLTVDGDWGTNTVNAIKKFRKKNGWTVNGKVNLTVLKKLLSY